MRWRARHEREEDMTKIARRRQDERDYKRLIIATMPLFFAATFISRALPWNWGRDKRSLFQATRANAHNTILFAFM
jgi:hypothetical protein